MVIQAREGGGLNQAARGGEREERLDSGYFLNVEKYILLEGSLNGMRESARSSVTSRFLTRVTEKIKPRG